MTDRDALLLAVCRTPEDDLPRLAYADLLEEQGDTDRAEFIREQLVTASASQGMPGLTMSWRERQLLLAHWLAWLHAAFDSLTYDVGVSAEVDDKFGVSLYDERRDERAHFDCAFRRGFVFEVRLPLADFMAHAAALFRAQPLESVILTDRCPRNMLSPDPGDSMWAWWRLGDDPEGTTGPEDLPAELWNRLPGGTVLPEHRVVPSQRWLYFPTEAAALSALAQACVAYGRALALGEDG